MENKITINGINYIREDSIPVEPVVSKDMVIIRTVSAGVFFGQKASGFEKLEKGIVELKNARRLWYWSGAASLSQLAVEGTSKPNDCKFPVAVPEISLTNVIEVIPCTEQAIKSLNSVKIWKA